MTGEISTEEAVSLMRRKFLDEGYTEQEAKRMIYRELLNRGVSFRDISVAFNTHTLFENVPKRIYDESSPLYGCPTNDDGYAIDPITQEEIPEELVVSYTHNGIRYCFNKLSLYKFWKESDSAINPLTREPLPNDIVKELKDYGESLRVSIWFGDVRLVMEEYTTIGELLLEVLRKMLERTTLLEDVLEYDVISDNMSLYEMGLNSTIGELSEVYVEKFHSPLHKQDSLSLLFDFARQRRGTGTYDTLYSHLGAALAISPVLRVDGGLDYSVPPNAKVIDVILTCYEFLQTRGHNLSYVIREYNIVLADGTALSSLGLERLATEVIPSEEIFHIPYDFQRGEDENEDEVLNSDYDNNLKYLRAYAMVSDNRELAGICANWVDEYEFTAGSILDDDEELVAHLINSGFYTLRDVTEYMLRKVWNADPTPEFGDLIYELDPYDENLYDEQIVQYFVQLFKGAFEVGTLEALRILVRVIQIHKFNRRFLGRIWNRIRDVPENLKPYLISLRLYRQVTKDDKLANYLANERYDKALRFVNTELIAKTNNGEFFRHWVRTEPKDEAIKKVLKYSIELHSNDILEIAPTSVDRKLYLDAVLTMARFSTSEQFSKIFTGITHAEYEELFVSTFAFSSFMVRVGDLEYFREILMNDSRTTSDLVNRTAEIVSVKRLQISLLIRSPLFTAYERVLTLYYEFWGFDDVLFLLENVSDEYLRSNEELLASLNKYRIYTKYLKERQII